MPLVALTVLLIILMIGFAQAPQDAHGRRPITSSYVVVLISVSIYILLPTILIIVSGGYTWAINYYSDSMFAGAIWLSNLGLAVFIYGNVLSRRRYSRQFSVPQERNAPSSHAENRYVENIILFSLLGIGIALKLYLIAKTGGVEQSVTRLSGYARQFSGLESLDARSIQVRTISGVADGAATWGVLRALRDHKLTKTWCFLLLATLALSYITIGKRLSLLLPLVCVLVGVHVYRKSLTTRLLPVVLMLAVAFGFITLTARVFLPASVAGYDINLDSISYAGGSMLRFYLYSLEFSSVEMITVAMQSRSEILGMFGGAWRATTMTNIDSFWYSVPRELWPSKPSAFYDLSYGISAQLGATDFQDPTVGFASTIIGTSYLMGGVICTIVAMLMFGVFTARIDRWLLRHRYNDTSVILFAISLVVTFHLFRQGTLGWTFIVAIVQQYGTIAALLILATFSNRYTVSSSTRSLTPSIDRLSA